LNKLSKATKKLSTHLEYVVAAVLAELKNTGKGQILEYQFHDVIQEKIESDRNRYEKFNNKPYLFKD
jgi:hypothetical protein